MVDTDCWSFVQCRTTIYNVIYGSPFLKIFEISENVIYGSPKKFAAFGGIFSSIYLFLVVIMVLEMYQGIQPAAGAILFGSNTKLSNFLLGNGHFQE